MTKVYTMTPRVHSIGCVVLLALICLTPTVTAEEPAMEDGWDIKLNDFFLDKKNDRMVPFTVYARSVDGKWQAGVGSSRGNFTPGQKPKRRYNTSWQHADLSDVHIVDGKMQGKLVMHMTPDLWVPITHRSFPLVFEIDAALNDQGLLEGSYTVERPAIDEPTLDSMSFAGGTISSVTNPQKAFALPTEDYTLRMNFHGTAIGGSPRLNARSVVLMLGISEGKLVKASFGSQTQKGSVSGQTELDPAMQDLTHIGVDGIKGVFRVPAMTLDMEPCEYVIEVQATFQNDLITGVNTVTVKREGKEDYTFPNSFDGNLQKGISSRVYKSIFDETWFVPVADHVGIEPGERPRLLFRKDQLPALRKKAETPAGQAILKRLRYLLNAGDGRTEALVFNHSTEAYSVKDADVAAPGIYTFTHIVGYGLLYQLTGDTLYADLGKKSFERALAGQRCRDDRYSFTGGVEALRTGPVLGWTAVGYDLCYDGWDKEFQEKATRELAEYAEVGLKGKGLTTLDLLAWGGKPPGSNHYGMEIGGAALAILALDQEPYVDQDKMDILKKVVRRSLIRNAAEGFGDGGVFQEGDGTGSMGSFITYLSALQAWRNVVGEDMIDNGRPDVPMMTMKWVYLSRLNKAGILKRGLLNKKGVPEWRPSSVIMDIRGNYGHNVWDRGHISGAGYFAHGFGSVTSAQQPALLGFYDLYFREIDEALGMPLDTVSKYPHLSVSSFVNWPLDIEPVNPAEVLPKTHVDTRLGFYLWRDRWQDHQDFVMSLQAQRLSGGYMSTRSDQSLSINNIPWIEMKKTKGVKDWWSTPEGDKSIMTFNKDASLLVDFSKASGADVLLATTAPIAKPDPDSKGGTLDTIKVKVGKAKVGFLFPRAQTAPEITVDGNVVSIGGQKLVVEGKQLSFAE